MPIYLFLFIKGAPFCRLSVMLKAYIEGAPFYNVLKRLAHPARLERAACGFEVRRSIQLSYGCEEVLG